MKPKAIWKIESLGYATPLVEAETVIDAITLAKPAAVGGLPDDDFIDHIMSVTRLGFLPEEFNKLGK